MEIALIHNDQLILGPMGFNVRMINSELEDLELNEIVTTESHSQLPIHFSDGLTHLVFIEKEIPFYDSRYHNLGNFSWEIIKENDIPIKVKLTYPVYDKTLDEVKDIRKKELKPVRKIKEDRLIDITIRGVDVQISTSREERNLLATKLSSSSGLFNYKFQNTWIEIDQQDLQLILSEIDSVVQQTYDWELNKLNEIDSCTTVNDVYAVQISIEG